MHHFDGFVLGEQQDKWRYNLCACSFRQNKKYPGSNQLIFGVKSKKEPQPILVKKMILVLIASNILGHAAKVEKVDICSDKDVPVKDRIPVLLKAVLGYSCRSVINGVPTYAMFDDYYWHRIKVINPVPL